MTWRIGTYVPSAGFRFPIYLTIQSEDHDFQRTVEGLVTRNDGPFILAAPTHDLLNSVGGAVLERGGVSFVALSELLALGKDGSPVAAESAAPLLDRLRAALVGEPATPEGAELPHCRVVTLKGTHTMDSDEYKELVARASEYDLFIDGISRNALRRYDGEAMAPEMLTPGEFAMIAEYIESRKIMRPTGTKVGTGKTADTARKLFDRGRRKVDISLQRYVWLYFRTHKATEPDATAFEFSPPEGTSWCLILPAQT
ncbi:MAG: hypothetical protein OEY97_12985 [Nitrospirota bacterium]|nr:hypothetical protein [Nitrospirota bacterium]